MIYPGVASSYHRFEVERGLEALRNLISDIKDKEKGVILVGDVGVPATLVTFSGAPKYFLG